MGVDNDFQHDFDRMTDNADSSVVLAGHALFRECNNQRLSPWGRPYANYEDPDLGLHRLHISYSSDRNCGKICKLYGT